jgi:hypothetical protein
MSVAAKAISARLPAIKCRICGRKAPSGSKLCGECVAAVRRARQVGTITSQFLPPLGLRRANSVTTGFAGTGRRVARRRTVRSWLPKSIAGWGVVAAFALFAALVGVIGYFAVTEIDEEAMLVHGAPPASDAEPALPALSNESAETWMFERPVVVDSAYESQPQVTRELSPPPAASPSGRSSVRESRLSKPAPATDSRSFGTSDAQDGGVGTDESRGSPPIPATTIANASAEPAVPDRWQSMNEALARCSRENFLAGIVCGERARLQYCDGFWGQVPQCRGASRSENAR